MMRQTLFVIACLSACTFLFSSFTTDVAPETGKCGYYADSYQGRATSSGEKYNKDVLTCSHKTLPFGTKIRVTRLDNKKSVVVRVNDRGPYIEGYVTDVSGQAAKELDLISKGTAQVKIEVVETAQSSLANDTQAETDAVNFTNNGTVAKPVSYSTTTTTTTAKGITNTAPTASKTNTATTTIKVPPTSNLYKVDIKQSEKKGYGIQIVSLNDANSVLPFMKELQAKYPGKVLVNVVRDEFNNPTYKVFVGPFEDKKSAETAQKTVAQKYKKTMVVDLSAL
jgi:rare lipoprotein A